MQKIEYTISQEGFLQTPCPFGKVISDVELINISQINESKIKIRVASHYCAICKSFGGTSGFNHILCNEDNKQSN